MTALKPSEFRHLYELFDRPITDLNCGDKCAPYNQDRIPFCCDTRHAVPSAYLAEWDYLQSNTNLWRLWEERPGEKPSNLHAQKPAGQVLIQCLGHLRCQRAFRSMTCRSFPFFPYIDREKNFIGISYYWIYEDRCWVISNLHRVNADFRTQFIAAYDLIFERMPEERKNFHYHSMIMRRVFGRQKRYIPLLHRDGNTYNIHPSTGLLTSINPTEFPKFDPYRTMLELPFPDEVE